jgi:hypothetical protein
MRRCFSYLPLSVLLVSLAWPSPGLARETRMMNFAVPEEGRAERVYFTSASGDEAGLVSLYRDLIGRGARNVICFLPKTIACELPAGVSPQDFSKGPGISFVFASQLSDGGANADVFTPVWIERCRAKALTAREEGLHAEVSSGFDTQITPDEAILEVPGETVLRTQTAAREGYPEPRNINQNSELMTGSILVNVIFPESSPHPFHQEEWTDESIAAALGDVSLSLMYYQNEYRKAALNFLVRPIERVLTGVEPINLDLKDESWIEEVMDRLGYDDDGTPDRHLTAVHEFNNDKRAEFRTQWVFTAFIVNAEKDPDHLFNASRTLGWGFLGGPYFVIPHPPGTTATDQAFKHFMGSMFWALGEGTGAVDNCGSYSGYLNSQNRNKTVRYDSYGGPVGCPGAGTPAPCIMNDVDAFQWFYSGEPCPYTAKMIGLSDFNRNSIPDCLDAPPVIYWENAAAETVFAQGSGVRFKAVSEGVTNQNPRQDPALLVNYAVPVKFVGRSENGVITHRLMPLDGVYDELEEDFEFTLDMLAGGSSQFSIVTRNTANAQSAEQVKEIYYIGLSYLHFGYQNRNEGNLIKFDLLGDTFDARIDVHRVDLEGDEQDRVIASGVQPYHSTGTFTLYQYFDEDVIPGVKYCYYVDGTFTTDYHGADTTVTTRTYDIETRSMIPIPEGGVVSEASPNPFRDRTMVSVIVPTTYDDPSAQFPRSVPTDTNVWVYDVLGRRVKRLYSERVVGQVLTLVWDGTNESQEQVPAGVYFVKAFSGGAEGAAKVVVVR